MSDYFDNWTSQARKGLLDMCILRVLVEREYYGYELVKTLVDVPGLGLTEGTLYPLLSRLRVQGLVTTRLEESSEGPARKYYSLTRDGKKALEMMEEYMDTLNAGSRSLRKKGERA
jgi:PadR family transcriptional regulator PadR